MKLATSPFTDDITIHAGDEHRTITSGEVVDLDDVLTDGQTLAHHLGAHADAFVVSAKKPARPVADVKPEPKIAPAVSPTAKE